MLPETGISHALGGVCASLLIRRIFRPGSSQNLTSAGEARLPPSALEAVFATDVHSTARDLRSAAFSSEVTLCMCSMVRTGRGLPAAMADTVTKADSLSKRYWSAPLKSQ